MENVEEERQMIWAGSVRVRITRKLFAVSVVGLFAMACGAATGPAPSSTASSAPASSASASAVTKQCTQPLKNVTMAVGGSPAISEVVIPEALGYYATEACVHVSFQVIPNSVGLLAALRNGQVQYSGIHPSATLSTQSQQAEDLRTVSVCAETHSATWGIGVRPDSSIASVRDLRGKKIGVPNFANSEAFGIESALAAEGMDWQKDVSLIQVSTGAALGNALQTSQVDAIVAGDIEFTNTSDLIGFKFKMLPFPDTWKNLSVGYGISVSRDYYTGNKTEIAGVCKAMAMGQVFALTNPDAAIQLFWKMLPEAKGAGDAVALHRASITLQTRQAAWTTCGAVIHCPNYQWGDQPAAGWVNYAKFLGVTDKVGDVTRFYTNEFLPQINSLDIDGVANFAKSYVFKG